MTNLEMIKAAAKKYNTLGFRAVTLSEFLIEIGEIAPKSYDWDFENDTSTYWTTGDQLPGTSAIQFVADNFWLDGSDDEEAQAEIDETLRKVLKYKCDKVVLLGSQFSQYGDDPDEVIMEDAVYLGDAL